MHILSALHRFAESGAGNVKALQGREEFRLRISDYRLFFVCPDPDTIEIRRVFHRSEAYAELRIRAVEPVAATYRRE